MNDPVRIFVSYSHSDAEYLGESSLLGFLRGLEKEGAEFWTDKHIIAGDDWDKKIRDRIDQSDIALVLVSQRFLDSDYCTKEIEDFLDRRRESGLIIVPVILSACEWERHAWLRETQYLPPNRETIREHYVQPGPRERIFLDIRSALLKQMETVRKARRAVPAAQPVESEHRQVTVLECELTAATASHALDMEELVPVLPDYRARATGIVERRGGHVAQREGERLVAYFGVPRLHEDDARRAVLAARELVALPAQLAGAPSTMAVRLAIHTGQMVVSTAVDEAEPIVVGKMPDVLAAVLDQTPPNRIHLTAQTHDLIEREFACAAAGSVTIEGDHEPVEFFALEAVAPAPPARRPFVARDQELEILRQRWALTRGGNGQVVHILGEPGIGKSRLVQEFAAEVAGEAMTSLACRCSQDYQNTELHPIIDLVRSALQVSDLETLEAAVRDLKMSPRSAPLLAALLSLAPPPAGLSPEGRRKNTLAAVLELILRLAARKTLLLVVEDLHWSDASSRTFLGQLIQEQAAAPVLTLLTFRREFVPPWRRLSHLSELSLGRLAPEETGGLVSLLAEKQLPPNLVNEIVRRSDGIPLFAEELTKWTTESENAGAAAMRVPATLTGSLLARLDMLGTAKDIAQVASVIGREFSCELLSQIVDVESDALERDLDSLLQSEIIRRRPLDGGSYVFWHVLIQETAYESLLPHDARRLHGRIAGALESKFPDVVRNQPEIVALHLTRAGVVPKAILYWGRAAERSIKNSANLEAVAHLEQCLELLATLPESAERDRQEMKLRIALSLPLLATKGYSAVEVDETLTRAKQLCLKLGDEDELFRVLRLFWSFQAMRGAHREGTETGRQMLAMTTRRSSPQHDLEAHRVLGTGFFYRGRMKEAWEHLERAFDSYDRERDHSLVHVYGQDPGVSCLSFATATLWNLGRPELALIKGREAVALARELGHPYSLCFALIFSAWQHIFRGELEAVETYVNEMMGIAHDQSFAPLEAIGVILSGWVSAQRGAADGLVKMSRALAGWQSFGARVFVPTFSAFMAEIHAERGNVEQGLAAVDQGLQACETNGEGLCEPELYRLKGELLAIQTPGAPSARENLLRARQVAIEQSARALEFRAVLSLARFWLAAGDDASARKSLDETRGWFRAEDGEDVRRADALRASLGD